GNRAGESRRPRADESESERPRRTVEFSDPVGNMALTLPIQSDEFSAIRLRATAVLDGLHPFGVNAPSRNCPNFGILALVPLKWYACPPSPLAWPSPGWR